MFTVSKRVRFTVDALRMTLGERAWDDPSEDWSALPFFDDKVWTVTIDLATGKIRDWPAGKAIDLESIKVCDEGTYELLSGDEVIATIDGYVPDPVPGKDGDYVDLNIAADGTITNWPKRPDLSKFDDKGDE